MLRESVRANCSVNLSVSRQGDDDHDDLERATTGVGRHPGPEARADDDRCDRPGRALERQVWRLWVAFERDGPAGAAHGNRGRPSERRLDHRAPGAGSSGSGKTYADVNDSHLAELFPERRGHHHQPTEPQRILRAAGLASSRRRRPLAPWQPARADRGRGPPPARRQPS